MLLVDRINDLIPFAFAPICSSICPGWTCDGRQVAVVRTLWALSNLLADDVMVNDPSVVESFYASDVLTQLCGHLHPLGSKGYAAQTWYVAQVVSREFPEMLQLPTDNDSSPFASTAGLHNPGMDGRTDQIAELQVNIDGVEIPDRYRAVCRSIIVALLGNRRYRQSKRESVIKELSWVISNCFVHMAPDTPPNPELFLSFLMRAAYAGLGN